MKPVRLYGRVVGHGSHARVTAGFRHALTEADVLAGLFALDEDSGDLDAPEPPGALAPVAVFTGPLHQSGRMRVNTRHERRCTMVAPNSDKLPAGLAKRVAAASTDILAPSDWAAAVLRKHFTLPVTTVPHGVLPAFSPHPALRELARKSYQSGRFEVLHFSTSERERKGTRVLVEAWERLVADKILPAGAQLTLVLDYPALASFQLWIADERDGRMPPQLATLGRPDLGAASMADLLIGQAHVVCQPSRGEAFGMVPLEALACGVPIIATTCTGHGQYLVPLPPGAVGVEGGADEPIDDLPGALAPAVRPDAVAVALHLVYEQWAELDAAAAAGAADIGRQWSWERQLAEFIEELKKGTS
jgi:glycosyltransferase involved in cell wall biosynthesis